MAKLILSKRNRLHEVSELEPLVIRELDKLDHKAGLELLEQQLSLGEAGRSDLLAIDRKGALCVIELKSDTADARAIAQVIRYLNFYERSRKEIARSSRQRINARAGVRLYLVAPEFDQDAKRLAYLLKTPISLVRYDAKAADARKGGYNISFARQTIRRDDFAEIKHFFSPREIIARIEKPDVRNDFCKAMRKLKTKGLDCRPYLREGRNAFEFRCMPYRVDDDVAYLTSYADHFVAWWYDPAIDEFRQKKCRTYDEWSALVLPKVLDAIE